MLARPAIIGTLGLVLVCGCSTERTAPPRLPRELSFLRFINLTSESVVCRSGEQIRADSLVGPAVSPAAVVAQTKITFSVSGPSGSGAVTHKPLPGKMTTIVYTGKKTSTVELIPDGPLKSKGGESLVELLNLCSQSRTFVVGGKTYLVESMKSTVITIDGAIEATLKGIKNSKIEESASSETLLTIWATDSSTGPVLASVKSLGKMQFSAGGSSAPG